MADVAGGDTLSLVFSVAAFLFPIDLDPLLHNEQILGAGHGVGPAVVRLVDDGEERAESADLGHDKAAVGVDAQEVMDHARREPQVGLELER